MSRPPGYPPYAPPRWVVGRAVWRFWTKSPARLLAQRIADSVVCLLLVPTLLLLRASIAYWIC